MEAYVNLRGEIIIRHRNCYYLWLNTHNPNLPNLVRKGYYYQILPEMYNISQLTPIDVEYTHFPIPTENNTAVDIS